MAVHDTTRHVVLFTAGLGCHSCADSDAPTSAAAAVGAGQDHMATCARGTSPITSSHYHILTLSHPHTITSSHYHILTLSHPHILTLSQGLSVGVGVLVHSAISHFPFLTSPLSSLLLSLAGDAVSAQQVWQLLASLQYFTEPVPVKAMGHQVHVHAV